MRQGIGQVDQGAKDRGRVRSTGKPIPVEEAQPGARHTMQKILVLVGSI